MPSYGNTKMPPGAERHINGICKALEMLIKSRNLTQDRVAARSEMSIHQVRTLLGKMQTGQVFHESLSKMVWACEMTPGEFFGAVYGFYSEEDLKFLPPDVCRRVTELREILDKAGLPPLDHGAPYEFVDVLEPGDKKIYLAANGNVFQGATLIGSVREIDGAWYPSDLSSRPLRNPGGAFLRCSSSEDAALALILKGEVES